MSLYFLKDEDFGFEKGPGEKKILVNGISGLSLVLFYSPKSKFCKEIIPIFKELPDAVSGCRIAVFNIDLNREMILASKETTTPILYVPYIMLYLDGKPYICYKNSIDIQTISSFILSVSRNMNHKQKFVRKEAPVKDDSKGIPAYTVGHPVCGNGVCYLEFSHAYSS